MAKKRKRLTQAEIEYNKNRKRITQFIRRAESRGYRFDDNILPKKPKRVTAASVRRLKKLTPEALYKRSVYGGEATFGEIVPGVAGRKLEKKASANKAAQTRRRPKPSQTEPFQPPTPKVNLYNGAAAEVIISNFVSHVRGFNEHAQQVVMGWLRIAIDKHGKEDVAVMLNKAADEGHIITYKIAYDDEKLAGFLSDMIEYLPEAGELTKEEFADAMEEEENFNMRY